VKPDQQQKDKGYQGFPTPLGPLWRSLVRAYGALQWRLAISRGTAVLLFGDKPRKIS
jgi:hypothetical protein